jgi:hypothetical protein
MSLYTLETKDILPAIKMPKGITIEDSTDVELLAKMGNSTSEEVLKRMANDHEAFVASINNIPAAFGWMARGKAFIGELAHELILPVGNRYLWNFRTMEPFRGLSIYPALLQYIINYEREKATRFWIIHAPESWPSLSGIQKAGFQFAGRLYSNNGMATIENTYMADANRKLLAEMDIIISGDAPASCWNCSSPFLKRRKAACCCAATERECVGNNLLSLAS